jgi:formyltetrahydrofolate-dependent phosphoribosylglycinamide formyltransferase
VTARVAVLASGGGSNLQALLEHLDSLGARRAADVVLVASDRRGAGALERARARGLVEAVLPRGDGVALDAALREHAIDLVVLAGYLRMIPREVTRRFEGRMLNVHPSLLPSFGGHGLYGARVHEAVLAAGVRVSGATVHFVDERYDEGAIAAQWPVPVVAGDTAATLAERVLRVEHLLLPRCVQALAAGRLRLEHGRVIGAPSLPPDAAFIGASGVDVLRAAVDGAFDPSRRAT